MERELAAYTDWTEETLLQRREKIVTRAKERWGLPAEFAALGTKPDLQIEDEENQDNDSSDPVVDPENATF